jgi:hypothetical protein
MPGFACPNQPRAYREPGTATAAIHSDGTAILMLQAADSVSPDEMDGTFTQTSMANRLVHGTLSCSYPAYSSYSFQMWR